jgi:hypothetical protein
MPRDPRVYIPLASIIKKVKENHGDMKMICFTSDESDAVCEVRWKQYQDQVHKVNKELWKLAVLQKQNRGLSNIHNEIKNLLK